MKLPGLLSRGSNLTEWSRFLDNYLRSITPRSSSSVRVSIGAGGATFAADVTATAAASPRAATPGFSLFDASTKVGDVVTKQIRITNGLISLMGSLGFSEGITGLPSGMTEGGTPPYIIELSDTDKYAWLGIEFDDSGDQALVSSIWIAAGATCPANTLTELYIPLGDFDASGTSSVAIGSGNPGIGSQSILYCGGASMFGPT